MNATEKFICDVDIAVPISGSGILSEYIEMNVEVTNPGKEETQVQRYYGQMKTFRCMANQGDDDDSIEKLKLATTAVREKPSTSAARVIKKNIATIHADLALFLNTPPKHGEGRAGDLHSIWSAVRFSLNISAASIALCAYSATLVTSSIELGWQKRHLVLQLLKEAWALFVTGIMRSLTESSELSLTPWVQKYKEQPLPGTSGNNRPDLTVIAPDDSYAIIADVSCSFEGSPTALEEAAQAKLLKYEPLRQSLLRFPQVTILPFIVGSLGSWYPPNDKVLSNPSHRIPIRLPDEETVCGAIAGSQTVWYQTMCSPHWGARVSQPPDPLASNAPAS
ncbi:hypothetical protein EMCRGX_G005267 [Ephydatia muelleri]